MKARGYERPVKGYIPIHMPKNTGTGVILSGISVAFAFGMIWYIWWLAALSFAAIVGVAIVHSFNYDRDFHIPVEDVVSEENRRTRALMARA